MLSRLISRLLFKALLSLAMLLGIASYGLYLSGGDPKAVWQRVASEAIGSLGESARGIGERVSAPVDALKGSESPAGPAGHVWTWRDENGLAHYASAPPVGVTATAVGLDPDVNVLAPVARRAPVGESEASGGLGALMRASGRPPAGATIGDPADKPAGATFGAPAGARVPATGGGDGLDEPLPGIAGAVARARGDAPAPDPARAEALLRMLQMH